MDNGNFDVITVDYLGDCWIGIGTSAIWLLGNGKSEPSRISLAKVLSFDWEKAIKL